MAEQRADGAGRGPGLAGGLAVEPGAELAWPPGGMRGAQGEDLLSPGLGDPVGLMLGRAGAIRQAGGEPFRDYQLPEAVILFKQGFGRLIRSKTDTGFVVVLDHRIATRPYGRAFLEALPDIEIVRDEFCGEAVE